MTSPPTDPAGAERWAAAARLADGQSDDGLRRRRTRVFVWLGALVLVSWAVGVVLALVLAPGTGSSHASGGDGVQLLVQLLLLLLGLVVGIVGFVWAYRSGHYVTRWRSVSSPLSRAEQRSVRRQIAGQEPIDDEHADIVFAVAVQNRRATLGILPIFGAVMLFAASTAVSTDSLPIKLIELVASFTVVLGLVQLALQYRRAGRFLSERPVS
ncbi:hypothetical protein [Curtobacterium flaccumfaciens]|uniref:hypothetical protein n=1 Tax=Curtobacterium flaccumfaciens TaxID=2035 RepID=UPI000FFEF470|nr:hypothetical protein [Curtobacterium flaccumfaciens]MCS0644739.1 hypothetical protein [Curtobacterium flaccumfaciens pv. flaccumfaciens]MCS6527569.1 hypothetical protein [Curtobacterium flaccumfaciens pv. flaccumfaciens]MCS6527901.1 hypothetical protein [Curtobacterium flaccumfaciens pv. flaccumfaciens]NUU10776.1 hypothetical protein [Curtobacterium flaccumfaciens]RXF85997.1 hypothetical protein CffCFBP3418_04235 [Curtobacterium flaccumfaciens pv. flaccumfaciens]